MVKEPQTTRSFHWFSPGFSLVMLEIFRREDEGPEGLALVTNRAAQRSEGMAVFSAGHGVVG